MPVKSPQAAFRRLFDEVGAVDCVGVEERVAKYTTRSIKKASKLWGLKKAVTMVDLILARSTDNVVFRGGNGNNSLLYDGLVATNQPVTAYDWTLLNDFGQHGGDIVCGKGLTVEPGRGPELAPAGPDGAEARVLFYILTIDGVRTPSAALVDQHNVVAIPQRCKQPHITVA